MESAVFKVDSMSSSQIERVLESAPVTDKKDEKHSDRDDVFDDEDLYA